MIGNPEFRRNLLIELNLQRLVVLPAVLLAVAALTYWDGKPRPATLAQIGEFAFYLMVYLWGSRRAAASVAEEVSLHTWDGQRMSALGAWSMTWGKLFGATVYTWYGGLLALAMVVAAEILGGLKTPEFSLQMALYRVAGGLLVHAVALAASLVLLSKGQALRRLNVTGPQAVGLLAGMVTFATLDGLLIYRRSNYAQPYDIDWYGLMLVPEMFYGLSLIAYAAWAVLAVHRLMRPALQFRCWPWAWTAFLVFVAVHISGQLYGRLIDVAQGLTPWLAAPFLIALLGCYVVLLCDVNDARRYRALMAAWRRRGILGSLHLLPRWSPAVILLMAISALLVASGMQGGWRELGVYPDHILTNGLVVSVVIFLWRDLLFVLLVNASSRYELPDLTAVAYLAVGYLLLAVVPVWFDFLEVAALFAPSSGATAGLWGPIAGLAQVIVLGGLVVRLWRRPLRPA
jgi:hypothetical protein